MKTKILFLSLFTALLSSATAQAFLFPTNPAPSVQLSWTPSATPGVTGYFVYYGIGSQQYTNKIPLGNITNTTVVLPARGVTYFFAVTAMANGLESSFSNEATFTPALPPAPPHLNPVAVLTVQASPTPNGEFADAINWSITPDQAQQFFRLKLCIDSFSGS